MDLRLDPTVAAGYTSRSQVARLITEDWASRNLFCVACLSDEVNSERANTPVTDYRCPVCGTTYQLKSRNGSFGSVVNNSGYEKKLAAILGGTAPHYAFIQYSSAIWQVTDLFVIPGHFFTPAVIQARNPLSERARRSGWIGSNILLGKLPADARVQVIASSVARDAGQVRKDWGRYGFLQADERARGGWGAAVLSCVRALERETGTRDFTLQDFYARFTSHLASQFPNNRNVEAKVRQQLQVLRDGGILTFVKPGHYMTTHGCS